jgi:hypothetical protein
MATKKATRKSASPRPDRYSKKKSGYISTSLRMIVADNKILRKAATLDGLSINHWCMRLLLTAAKKRIGKSKYDDGPTAERMRQATRPLPNESE